MPSVDQCSDSQSQSQERPIAVVMETHQEIEICQRDEESEADEKGSSLSCDESEDSGYLTASESSSCQEKEEEGTEQVLEMSLVHSVKVDGKLLEESYRVIRNKDGSGTSILERSIQGKSLAFRTEKDEDGDELQSFRARGFEPEAVECADCALGFMDEFSCEWSPKMNLVEEAMKELENKEQIIGDVQHQLEKVGTRKLPTDMRSCDTWICFRKSEWEGQGLDVEGQDLEGQVVEGERVEEDGGPCPVHDEPICAVHEGAIHEGAVHEQLFPGDEEPCPVHDGIEYGYESEFLEPRESGLEALPDEPKSDRKPKKWICYELEPGKYTIHEEAAVCDRSTDGTERSEVIEEEPEKWECYPKKNVADKKTDPEVEAKDKSDESKCVLM